MIQVQQFTTKEFLAALLIPLSLFGISFMLELISVKYGFFPELIRIIIAWLGLGVVIFLLCLKGAGWVLNFFEIYLKKFIPKQQPKTEGIQQNGNTKQ